MSEPVMTTDTPLIAIADISPRPQVTLKGDLASAALQGAVQDVVGVAVPGPLTHCEGKAIWMAPDEVLLLPASAPEAVAALEAALAGHHAMALDVTDARAVLRLTGARVGEVLAKGAPCDCSDAGFAPGTARRTHMGGLAVGIWRLDAATWEIVCFRSYAHHLIAWLEQAAVPGSEVRT